MARTTRWTLWAAAAVTLIGAAACNDSQSPRPRALLGLPDVGTLAVTVTTSGSNTPSGYTVIVDGSSSQSVGATGVATFLGLPSGSHTVLLSGVPSNCSVSGDKPRAASLIAGLAAATTFSVSCTAPPPTATTGNLTVTTGTSGSNIDADGYTVTVDGNASKSIGTNGSVTFTGLSAASHTVVLSGVASNCSVSGGPSRTVSVPADGTASTSFSVSCAAPPPPTGNLTVTTSTTGSNLDPDGYTATVDGGASQAIGTNGSVTFSGLSAASHTVVLSGVASNCSVTGGTSRTVSVPAGGTASTSFSVSCTAPPPQTGNLTVTTSTTGSNLDPDGYTATVDGGASQSVGTNGSVTFTGLSAGSHSVALSGLAANCSVSGANPQTVTVPSGGTATATFAVSCAATGGGNGTLTVTTSTTGSDLDPDGYTVTLDGGATSQPIATNGSVSFTGPAGDHTVALSGMAGNCSVSGANPRTVTVPSGGTVSTTFSVTCAATGGGTGSLTVITSTTGSNLDPDGYTITIDGSFSQPIGTNASVTFTGPSGDHTLALSGVASNCSVSGANPRTVTVPSGGTTSTTFSVSCAATGGGGGSGEVIGQGQIGNASPTPPRRVVRPGAVRAPCGLVPRNSPWEHLVVQPCLVARVPSPQPNPGDGRTHGAQTARDEAQVPEEDTVRRGSHVARAACRRDRRRRVRDAVRPAGGSRRADGHHRRAARAGRAAAGPASPGPARGAAAGVSDRDRPDPATHVRAENRLTGAVRPE